MNIHSKIKILFIYFNFFSCQISEIKYFGVLLLKDDKNEGNTQSCDIQLFNENQNIVKTIPNFVVYKQELTPYLMDIYPKTIINSFFNLITFRWIGMTNQYLEQNKIEAIINNKKCEIISLTIGSIFCNLTIQ